MVEYHKGEILYYFIVYKDSSLPGLARLRVAEDHKSQYGLSAIMIIERIYTSQYIGSESRIIVGKSISANELQGVGLSGAEKYIFKSRETIIQNIFLYFENIHK